MRRRLSLVALMACSTLPLGSALLAPTADAAPRGSCQSLKGHDLAPAESVKLVQRRRGRVTELVGCSLPAGRVRVLASGSSGTLFTQDVKLGQIAGAYVAVTTTFGDQYSSGETTEVINVRSGRHRTIASFQRDVGTADPSQGSQAEAVIITPGGRGAAVVAELATGEVRVVAFAARGPLQTLDTGSPTDIPAGSVALSGSTVVWTNAAVARSAPLPG